jgi:hypothetical protein
MPVIDVNTDIQSVYNNGGKGFALFRYGVLDKDFFLNSINNGSESEINLTNDLHILNKTGILLFLLFAIICFGIGYWIRK